MKVIIDCGEFGTFGFANVERVSYGETLTVFYAFSDGETVQTSFVAARIVSITILGRDH